MSRDNLPRLFSLTEIGIATFLGSALAAGFMVASNYSALGQRQPAILALLGGLAIVGLFMLVPGNAQENPERMVFVIVGQVMLVLFITNALQGKMLASFREMGGRYHSMLRTVLISLAASLILGALYIAIAGPPPAPGQTPTLSS